MILLVKHPDVSLSETCVARLAELAACFKREFRQEVMDLADVEDFCSRNEVLFLFVCLPHKTGKVRKALKLCRFLRIPYVFLTDRVELRDFRRLVVPVGFLEEEVGKGQYAVMFWRFCQAHTTLLQANDYGSRAQRNVNKIAGLFQKFQADYGVQKARSDSFKLPKEAAQVAGSMDADMLMLSASRDYGLDDIFFGTPEEHAILKASIPVMLVNPRKDLYVLCD